MPHSEWGNLAEHLESAFCTPDLDALRIALATYCAHWLFLDDHPTWPLFIGVPGSGKSEIICTSLGALEGVIISSEVTPNTFISGAGKNLNGTSLLKQLIPLPDSNNKMVRSHGLVVFKDFTSIMELRPDNRAMITAQMRELWDNRYDPHKGVKVPAWEGKLTVQAVVTPSFEGAWAVRRNLGERFTYWRTKTSDGVGMVKKLLGQKNYNTVAKDTRQLTRRVMPANYTKPPTLPTSYHETIAHAAKYAAILRTHVERDQFPPRSVIGAPQPEAPTRISLAIAQLSMGLAHLRGAKVVEDSDLELALKVADYSIPRIRNLVMEKIEAAYRPRHEIVKATGLPESTVNWTVDELEALGAVEINVDTDSKIVSYKLGEEIAECRQFMKLPELRSISNVVPIRA